jgi:hypothetical protein
LYDLSGRRLGDRQATVDIAASNTASVFTVGWTASLPDLHLLRLELRDRGGALLSDNTYWRYRTAADMQALTTLAPTRLSVSAQRGRPMPTGNRLQVTVRNTGKTVAPMTRLSLRDHSGDRILPAAYGDNYLWLLPGESRSTEVSWFGETPRSASVAVSAYNAPEVIAG